MSAAALFVVATPIGNLEDITLRALATLREVDVIAAEDTRHTRKLLSAHGIAGKTLVALHAHSTRREVDALVVRLRAGERVALVTDAGTPGVSDPGDELVRAAVEAGLRVVPVPGPSAAIAALSVSGFGGGAFRFVGFLPREGTARAQALGSVGSAADAVVLFESPERAGATLADLAKLCPERPACVARELTKVHEEVLRGTLRALAHDGGTWRGEIVIVLGPQELAESAATDDEVDARIDAELAAGAGTKRTAELVAAWSGRPKREVYERILRQKRK